MIADSDIQVWLEAQTQSRPSVIVPYVQSTVDKSVAYRVRVTKENNSGRSEISQGGTIFMMATKPTPLGKMSLSIGDADVCEIELTLTETGKASDKYRFDCPR